MIIKPEILFITPRIPAPGIFGDQLRAWNFLVNISESFTITLVCMMDGLGGSKDLNMAYDVVHEVIQIHHPMKNKVTGALKGFLDGQPAQVGWYHSRELKKTISDLAATGRFRAAFVQTVRMASAIESLDGIPVVLDFVDALSMRWSRTENNGSYFRNLFNRQEASRLEVLEETFLKTCARCLATGPDDARHIEMLSDTSPRIQIVPNGVDMETFKPLAEERQNNEPVVLFSGNLDYLPNQEAIAFFANMVFPILKEQHNNLRFVAAGKISDTKFRNKYEGLDVEFTGFVDDLAHEIASADVVVAPMVTGAGIQNKVLEAMATGVPVVATHLANSAIDASHPREIRIGASAKSLADHISDLLNDPKARVETGIAGRQFVNSEFSWDAQAKVVEGHLFDACELTSRRGVKGPEIVELLNSGEGEKKLLESEEVFFKSLIKVLHFGISVSLLVLFAMIFPILAFFVKATSAGPVFYGQERLGIDRRSSTRKKYSGTDRRKDDLGGRPFTIWKLRSMRADAEATTGPVWAGENDPRITWLGRILRKTRLDEVPQLWNVVRGDMSLVGPRPERPHFAKQLRAMYPGYASRLRDLKPGLTGMAQVYGSYDTSMEKVNEKLVFDYDIE